VALLSETLTWLADVVIFQLDEHMKRAPLSYRTSLSEERRAFFRQIERDFHVRAFGEEMARVNLDMTKEERLRYLDWMWETARKQGVKTKGKFPYDGSFPDDQS